MLQQNKKNVMDGHSIKIRIKIYTRSTLHIMYYVLLFIYDYLEKSVRKKKRSDEQQSKKSKKHRNHTKSKKPIFNVEGLVEGTTPTFPPQLLNQWKRSNKQVTTLLQ